MTMSCQQMGDQMIDLLYGELPVEERALAEAHLAGCVACRAEVEAFRQTRALVRGALDEPMPARAREGILRAAAEQACLIAGRAAVLAPSASKESATEKSSTEECAIKGSSSKPAARAPRAGFWDWIRARWALPTLATVGAVAVFLLTSRLFFDPQKSYQRGRAGLLPPEPPAPASAPAPAAEAPADQPVAPAPAASVGVSGGLAAAPAPGTGGPSAGGAPAPAAVERSRSVATPHAEERRPEVSSARGEAKGKGNESANGNRNGNGNRSPAPRFARPVKPAADRDEDGAVAGRLEPARPVPFPPPPPRSAEKAPAAAGGGGLGFGGAAPRAAANRHHDLDDLAEASNRPPAEAPRQGLSPSAAPVEAQGQAQAETESAAAAQDDRPARRARSLAKKIAPPADTEPPPRPAPARVASAVSPKQKSVFDSPLLAAPASAPAASAAAARKKSGSDSSPFAEPAPPRGAPPPASAFAAPPPARAQSAPAHEKVEAARAPETLAQRAERLFTEARWTEAAVAYRDLLRQEPRSADAPRWRQRLGVAEQAAIAAPRR
jgi:hypothetical protein